MKNLFSFICLLSFSLLLAQDSAKWVAPIKSFSEIENDTIPSFEEPVKWTTSFEKLSDIEYELKFMAKSFQDGIYIPKIYLREMPCQLNSILKKSILKFNY